MLLLVPRCITMPGKQPPKKRRYTINALTADEWHQVRLAISVGNVWNPVHVYRIICRVTGQHHMHAVINPRVLSEAIRLFARQNTPPLNERTQR